MLALRPPFTDLEAEFYSWAAFGYGLDECKGKSVGGQKAKLTAPMQAYAIEVRKVEHF